MNDKLAVNEIFQSFQGEGLNTGRPCYFIRFSGCNLRCKWCDTDFKEHKEMTPLQIANKVENGSMVVITGGEPFIQPLKPFKDLLGFLKTKNVYVAVESNSSIAVPESLRKDIDWISFSPKLWGSISAENKGIADEIKIIVDDTDEEQLMDFISKVRILSKTSSIIWLQPEGNKTEFIKKAEKIAFKTGFRIGHQMHKIRNWR